MRRTRILVADAVPLFRAGVRNLLVRESAECESVPVRDSAE